jgi:hypothetical protein
LLPLAPSFPLTFFLGLLDIPIGTDERSDLVHAGAVGDQRV